MSSFLLGIYPWLKAAHLVMVIAWMAGMMYLPRLFIYHHQAKKGGEAEGFFAVMERRLYLGIILPSMLIVWVLGSLMILANPALLSTPWFLVKLAAVTGVTAFHGLYSRARKKFAAGERPKTEKYWRIVNEIPFVLMIVAVVMAIVRPF